MVKENVIVYPFDLQSSPLLRHNDMITNYNITEIVSPNGWGLCGKDAGEIDGGSNLGIIVKNDFEQALEHADAVLLADHYLKLDFDKYILPNIKSAICKKKNVICIKELIRNEIEKINLHSINNKIDFIYLSSSNNTKPVNKPLEEKIYQIDVPIIFVAGTFERTHKFHIQLALRKKLLDYGYKVSQIGSRRYCELFNFHSFPDFMFGTDLNDYEKIIAFNHYVKKIEITEHPDIILIGIPGAIFPYNNDLPCKFGIFAFEVSQAVRPDAVVISCLYEDYNEEFFKMLSNLTRYRFNFDIDCFNIANTSADIPLSKYTELIEYTTIDSSFVDRKVNDLRELNLPVFNIFNESDSKNMVEHLINKLSDYAKTQIV